MATFAQTSPAVPRQVTWLWEFLRHELAPYPGRVATVARMVLAVTLVMVICDTFRIPFAFLGGIYALLISRESPRATLNSVGTVMLLALGGVAYVVLSIQFVISVPVLHFLWNIVSFFLAFYALTALTNYGAFVALALVVSISVTVWDRHAPAGTNVADTLPLPGSLPIGGCYLRGGIGFSTDGARRRCRGAGRRSSCRGTQRPD